MTERDQEHIEAVERGDLETAHRLVCVASYDFLKVIEGYDEIYYKAHSEACRLEGLVNRRENIPEDEDVTDERKYIEGNRADVREWREKAAPAKEARDRAYNILPKSRVKLTDEVRISAGLLDLLDGGGIDFEESVIRNSELEGPIVQSPSGGIWLVMQSGELDRGTRFFSGGIGTLRSVGASTESDLDKPTDGSSVSSANPTSLVAIALTNNDEIIRPDPAAYDQEGKIIPLSQRFGMEPESGEPDINL